jgi:hypothetical protein
MMGGGYGMQ